MKPSLTFMDFAIVFVMIIAVATIAHFTLSHSLENADGSAVTGKLKPTLFGGKKAK